MAVGEGLKKYRMKIRDTPRGGDGDDPEVMMEGWVGVKLDMKRVWGKRKKADDNNIKARGKKKGKLSKMKGKLYCRQKGIKKERCWGRGGEVRGRRRGGGRG